MEKTAVKTLTTDRELRALRPTDRRQEYRDSEIRNLRVRVTQSGLISFALLVRPDRGNASRRRLGDYGRIEDGVFKAGGLSLKEARKLATIWNAKFQTGIDPRQEFRAALELKRAEKVKGVTLAIIASDYLSTRVLKKRAASSPLRRPKEIQQQLKFFTDAWPTKAANSITADDIEILLEPKAEKHPAMARNLFATLRALYNWAGRKRSYRPLANPCDGFDLEILGAKANRTRTLNHDELRLLARNLRRLSAPFGTLYRTLLLTGLRLNEAARAKWTEFDFENKVWEIPASRMKGKLPHIVPLTPDLLEVIGSIPRSKKAIFVFSTTSGKSPVQGISKVKARITANMTRSLSAYARSQGKRRSLTIPRWTNHDIRRTFRTELSALGGKVEHDVKEALLAHTKKGIIAVYDQYKFLDEKRAALLLWSDRLRAILNAPMGSLEKFQH